MSAVVVVRGSGSIGQRHARVLASIGAQVSLWPVRDRGGATDTDPATGARLLDDSTGPAALAAADLVVVATDTSRHVPDAILALDAGADRVLVEKPVAGTAELATPLTGHPRHGAVWVAAPLRAHAAFRQLLGLVRSAGDVTSAHVRCQSWLPGWRPDRDYRESYSARPGEGGVLRDLVHEIDYATVLLGSPHLVGADVQIGGPLDIDVDQIASLLWRTDRDVTVSARLDYVTRESTRGIVVHTRRATYEWDVLRAVLAVRAAEGEEAEATEPSAGTEHEFSADLDRDAVMATQARAALLLHPSTAAEERHLAGAPATLAEGVAAVRLCDEARSRGTREVRSATGGSVP